MSIEINSIHHLLRYWHVIALSKEVPPGVSLKRSLYGRPILLWRDRHGALHAMDDCCVHRRAPIEVLCFDTNQIVCPYHGWEYDATGTVRNVPSDAEAAKRLKCRIPTHRLLEKHGFVWILIQQAENLSDDNPLPELPVELSSMEHWPSVFLQHEFATTDLLLIENFMDPTHTSIVHDGLIRNRHQSNEHEMTVRSNAKGVHVAFAEREERVGFGIRFLFGNSIRVSHVDAFLLPNLVQVTYEINRVPRFLALIACTPLGAIDEGRTLAIIQLRYQFGFANWLARPFLKLLAKKVLAQDFAITAEQFRNQQRFPESSEHLVGADTVAVRVSQLRHQILQGHRSVNDTSQLIRLKF